MFRAFLASSVAGGPRAQGLVLRAVNFFLSRSLRSLKSSCRAFAAYAAPMPPPLRHCQKGKETGWLSRVTPDLRGRNTHGCNRFPRDFQPGWSLAPPTVRRWPRRPGNGVGPYNSSISTTDGYRQVVHTPMTRNGAEFYAELHIEDAQKWGSALAIPVAADSAFRFSDASFTITLPAEKPVLDWDGKPTGRTEQTSRYELIEAGRKEALSRYGSRVHAVAVTESLKTKIVVSQPAAGRGVTRWVFDNVGRTTYYDTKAQAITAAKESAGSGGVEERNRHPGRPATSPTPAPKPSPQSNGPPWRPPPPSPSPWPPPTTSTPDIAGWMFFGLAAI